MKCNIFLISIYDSQCCGSRNIEYHGTTIPRPHIVHGKTTPRPETNIWRSYCWVFLTWFTFHNLHIELYNKGFHYLYSYNIVSRLLSPSTQIFEGGSQQNVLRLLLEYTFGIYCTIHRYILIYLPNAYIR